MAPDAPFLKGACTGLSPGPRGGSPRARAPRATLRLHLTVGGDFPESRNSPTMLRNRGEGSGGRPRLSGLEIPRVVLSTRRSTWGTLPPCPAHETRTGTYLDQIAKGEALSGSTPQVRRRARLFRPTPLVWAIRGWKAPNTTVIHSTRYLHPDAPKDPPDRHPFELGFG